MCSHEVVVLCASQNRCGVVELSQVKHCTGTTVLVPCVCFVLLRVGHVVALGGMAGLAGCPVGGARLPVALGPSI